MKNNTVSSGPTASHGNSFKAQRILMNVQDTRRARLWYGPVVMLATFLLVFTAIVWLVSRGTLESRRAELNSTAESLVKSMHLRLKGNEDYLQMLAKDRAEGSLDAAQFQQRASSYALGHPEIINITWVDADYYIRDVSPAAGNTQILGLHLDLPEPKRVSRLARETRQPCYTLPFEAIQGSPSFEVWVPVFRGDRFLGLFGGVYSCQKLLQALVPPQIGAAHQVSLRDASGATLAQLSGTGHPDERLIDRVPLPPVGIGVQLQLGTYRPGLDWMLLTLEFFCLSLVLGMCYAMWGLKREIDTRSQVAGELRSKTAQLQRSEGYFRILNEQATEAILVYDVDLDRFVDANKMAEEMFGCGREELLKSGPLTFVTPEQPDLQHAAVTVAEHNRLALAGETPQFERAIRSLDGRDLFCEIRLTLLPDERRRLIRASYFDITERKRLEAELHRQAAQLAEELTERQVAQETLQDQTMLLEEEIDERRRVERALKLSETTVRNRLKAIMEPDGDIGSLELSDIIDCETLQSMLEDFYRLTGMLGAVLDVSGKVLVAVGWQDICTKFHRCHPETLKNCLESDTVLTNGVPVGSFKHYRCKNNMWDMVTPLEVGGRHVGNIFIGQFFYDDENPDLEFYRAQARRYGFDETAYLAALKQVPRFSRETAEAGMQFYAKLTKMISTLSFSTIRLSRTLTERIHLEEQLRQAQKMETVGQLAGGVAHDFNNILQVIIGYGDMLRRDDTLNERHKDEIDHILGSAEKASQLTRGLLAFSRKQVFALKPLNLNEVIENFRKFIVRVIGEDIQLKTITRGEGPVINADLGQMEQVLVNLATNARDAMKKGGVLTIETGSQAVEAVTDQESGGAEPGLYAVVTVSDTGCGMDHDTRQRIFEPFYTTKEVGEGTGLGMAIVYGIIKQHNGFINVYSEPGHGTTFRIYLPMYLAQQPEQVAAAAQVILPRGGHETILLAEDDADVRDLMVSVLTRFGYRVIQAVDGEDAVEKFAAHRGSIAMVVMDMIMPKKNGKAAYDEICLLSPRVKILYSSGYTADFIKDRGVCGKEVELIMKPVQPMELLRKVRAMLDA
jgi:PAS domain S-box-containing protein